MNNLTLRVLTALVAIPIIILICMVGGIWFFAFVAIVSAVALSEFYALARRKGAKPMVVPGIIAGAMIDLSFYHAPLRTAIAGLFQSYGIAIPFPSQEQLLLIVIVSSVVVLSLVELFRNDGSALLNLSTTVFGLFYVSLFFGTFVGLRELFTVQDPAVAGYFLTKLGASDAAQVYRAGGLTVISVFAMIWICDSAAFHVGSAMGRHKLLPRVSPKKSWEGAIAGFVLAIGSGVAAKYLVLDYLSVGSAAAIGAIVGTIGQLGDLTESLLKRDADVKDSSNLIPGHGGAFDRFDSLLLVSPLVYLYIDFIVF